MAETNQPAPASVEAKSSAAEPSQERGAAQRWYSVNVKSTYFDESEAFSQVPIYARAEGEAAYFFWQETVTSGATGKLRAVEIIAIVPM